MEHITYESFNDWMIRKQKKNKAMIGIFVFLTIPGLNIILWLTALAKYFEQRKEYKWKLNKIKTEE